MAITILALDIATNTGWAAGRSDAACPRYGAHRLPKTERGDMGRFFYEFRQWMVGMLREHDPAAIVFECPIMPVKTNITTTRKLYTLAGLVEEICYGSRCIETGAFRDVCEEQISTIKLFAAGHGRAEKRDMVRAVNRMFALDLAGNQDNEADALALWALAVHKLDEPNGRRFSLGAMGAAGGAPR